ncbi:MAG: transcriptional repressor NrdR [Clostridia bacterium]|nr:transcriptional repressor NrdR [Clostridia bacterium]
MKCPVCGHLESKVLDSRPSNEGASIRRRRECLSCFKRFTTFETIEIMSFMVVKKDKTREIFDRTKVKKGIVRACEKRPVTMEQIENAVSEIEQMLLSTMRSEISSEEIGELVMSKLKDLDEVAYVRFASVYRQFKDITTFRDELNKLLDSTQK